MILLIEDNAGDVLLFRKALAATASRCMIARDAAAGLELLQQRGGDFHVVVVDLRLPGDDGWSVLEYLRAHPQIRAEPVILTSSANERDRARAGALAVQHYRIKPDDFGTLQQTVQDIAALDHAPD